MARPNDLQKLWDQAAANKGETVPVGNFVVCDLCNDDYTGSTESGGFVFQSKGICPKCAPEFLRLVMKFDEKGYIRAHCPDGQSFADFIRAYRGPNAGIKITSF